MARIPLTGGAYQARSLVAAAQRSVNLFSEAIPQGQREPAPSTHYPTPGKRLLGAAPNGLGWRGMYATKAGDLYGVAGPTLYYISPSWAFTAVGTLVSTTRPVSMADNGATLLIVDGTVAGYTVNLATRAFAAISDAAFYGGDRVEYVDGFFVLNRPGTNQFYKSGLNAITWDALDFAAKRGDADNLAAVVVVHRDLWLLGTLTTELWSNVGGATFPFAIQEGIFVQHGCAAKGSIATYDLSVFWLSQEEQGQGIVLQGTGYDAKRISTHAIEEAIRKAPTLADAVGWTYQQGGHQFYLLTLPSLDRTFAYDMATGLWHERASADANGALHRDRGQGAAFAYGATVVGDWQNGNLYALDLDTFTDAGQPIPRIRSFPHLVAAGRRAPYRQFIADMDCGTLAGTTAATAPMVSLRWSDDGGHTWGNPVLRSLGPAGAYNTSIVWNRLGVARSRVFELSWSVAAATALQGAFVE